MKIKICGLRNPENIRQVERLHPDYTGYIFYKGSPRNVEGLPVDSTASSSIKVGVFVNESISEIIRLQQKYHLDYLQLHGNESPEFCQSLSGSGVKLIKAFRIDHSFKANLLSHYSRFCDRFLFDTPGKNYGGNGRKFNWNLLRSIETETPFFLSGGIGPEDAERVLEIKNSHPQLYGIDLNSRFELSPGIKDPSALGKFINELKRR